MNVKRKTLQVRRTLLGSKKGNPVFGVPKTAKGKRSVRLTDRAVKALQRYQELQIEERQRLDGLWQENGLEAAPIGE